MVQETRELPTVRSPDERQSVVPSLLRMRRRLADVRAMTVLPTPVSSFVGREQQLAEIERLLGSARMVTLTGPGGCGKSRLALEVAARVRSHFPHGVVFVPLASLRDPAGVATATAQVLQIPDRPDRSHGEAVAHALRGRMLLLVLDNFEHLLDAAPIVADWLAACPRLHVLATSRERLRLQGEQSYPVPPLSLGTTSRADVSEAEAVRLFVERARAVRPDFALTVESGPAVAEICERLDGLPLAIELAAARIQLLPPSVMATRLDRRLPLLTAGARDQPARQQTLRSTIGWSHDLLDERERRLFRRLSVFVGGFDLRGAEAVAGAPNQELTLAALVEKSLVHRPDSAAGQPRFSMLETIREYGLEQLAASGEEVEARRRHAAHVLTIAEAAAPELTGLLRPTWLQRLDREYPNVRAALQWLRDQGDGDRWGLRLATVLCRYWWLRSYYSEGRQQISHFLELFGEAAPATSRADARQALGELAFRQGDLVDARQALEEALALRQQVGDLLGTAIALRSLGRLAIDEGRHAEAQALLEADLEIEREEGHREGLPWALTYLSWLAIFAGEHARAGALLSEALALCEELGDREGIGRHHLSLGHLALDRGDVIGAQASFAESLAIFGDLDYKYGAAYALEGLSDVAIARGQSAVGLGLAGAAAALREVTGAAPAAEFRARHEHRVAQAREQLGDAHAAAAWAEGQALQHAPSMSALLQALTSITSVTAADTEGDDRAMSVPTTADTPAHLYGLTARQLEVVRLVVEGKTNREIAEALVVSERTVTSHLDHIFARLGVSSRTAVAAFALKNGVV